jgi:hypothetical protein
MKSFFKFISAVLFAGLFYTSSYSQTPKYTTVIIDTLVGIDTRYDDFDLRICLDTTALMHVRDTFINPTILKNKKNIGAIFLIKEKYVGQFYDEEQSVQSIDFPFDKGSSYVSIRRFGDTQEDTIRINKWKIYPNDITDTLYKVITYKNMINDSVVKEYSKCDTQLTRKKEKNLSTEDLSVVINGKAYRIDLIKSSTKVNGTFNGAFPLKRFRKYQNHSATKREYRYTRFYGEYIKYEGYYKASIYLNKNTNEHQ